MSVTEGEGEAERDDERAAQRSAGCDYEPSSMRNALRSSRTKRLATPS
jgi:hypothetical protein